MGHEVRLGVEIHTPFRIVARLIELHTAPHEVAVDGEEPLPVLLQGRDKRPWCAIAVGAGEPQRELLFTTGQSHDLGVDLVSPPLLLLPLLEVSHFSTSFQMFNRTEDFSAWYASRSFVQANATSYTYPGGFNARLNQSG